MATIYELAKMSDNVYSGSSSPNQYAGPGSPLLDGLPNWQVFLTSTQSSADGWKDGYFAVAYRNVLTGEIAISNRPSLSKRVAVDGISRE